MKILPGCLLILLQFSLFAQEKYFFEPVKIPVLLSASFAEIRNNHFHSGIDIKTNGKEGLPVYAAAEGYISRIVVAPNNFGNAIYIDHPNGTTTLYGHLRNFRDDIAQYVKNLQYEKESFSIDQKLPSHQFPVEKGELIAYSGNSGSSGGPHLHFDIRDTRTQDPMNPLGFHLAVTDKTPPAITSLKIYPLGEGSLVNNLHKKQKFGVTLLNGKYRLKNGTRITACGEIGFAVNATDYFDGSWNRCGINYLTLRVDSVELFSFNLNRFPLNGTHYINSHIDYEEWASTRQAFHKTWKDPGNFLDIYEYTKNFGIFDASDGKEHKVEIVVKDAYKNESVLEFIIAGAAKPAQPKQKQKNEATVFKYHSENEFEAPGIKLDCPEGSFYTDFEFDYHSAEYAGYSDIHEVHHNSVPIHDYLILSVKTKNLPEHLEGKTLLATIDKKTGAKSPAGGNFLDGWVTAKIKKFGNYVVAVDTVAPSIVPLSIKNKNTLAEAGKIRFRISDSFSGIESYAGYIDGKWALFEYDAKNNLLTYLIDAERIGKGKTHKITLEVTDAKRNTAKYSGTFTK